MNHIIIICYLIAIFLGISSFTMSILARRKGNTSLNNAMLLFSTCLLVMCIYDMIIYYTDYFIAGYDNIELLRLGDCIIAILFVSWLSVEQKLTEEDILESYYKMARVYAIAYASVWCISTIVFSVDFMYTIKWILLVSDIVLIFMMTGDNKDTAQAVAQKVGVDEFFAEVLPEDKAEFIRKEKAAGRTVIMIGDGVNDSPALSEADAGIAISTGAAIAREIADITIASDDLFELVTLRRLSEALMDRIHHNYRFIVGFNFLLIVAGVAGILPPTTSALLHNMSTLGISLKSMTNLLPESIASEQEMQ